VSQNTSSAVMAQRIEPHDSLDDFPTQPWATRALLEHVVIPRVGLLRGVTAWEPACNRGHMVKPLREFFGAVHATDIHDYSDEWSGQQTIADFLFPGSEPESVAANGVDWIITNPPFRLALQFLDRAFELKPREGVAIIVRTAFLEGVARYDKLFRNNPPSVIAQFSERVPMVKGRLTATGSTATAYCWLVWLSVPQADDVEFCWIPPCRKVLERPDDYPVPGSAE